MAAGQLFHEIIAHLRSTMSHIFSVGEKAKEIWNTVENSSIIGMWVSHHVLQTIHTSMLGEQKNNPSSRRKVHKSQDPESKPNVSSLISPYNSNSRSSRSCFVFDLQDYNTQRITRSVCHAVARTYMNTDEKPKPYLNRT